MYLQIFTNLWLYVTIGFLIAGFIKRNDIADVMWGPGIFISALTAVYSTGFYNSTFVTIMLVIVGLWALRIFIHIGSRFISKREEDFRYRAWRETWKYFYIRSYAQVFLIQGFLMFMVSSSVVFSVSLFQATSFDILNFNSAPIFYLILSLGSLAAVFGLIFEAIADMQLKRFLKSESNRGKIMQAGLWSLTRHPNYFGEVTYWWGVFLMSIAVSFNLYIAEGYGNLFAALILLALHLISPLTITYLILKVSGIPLLEKKYEGNPEFEKYKSKTPAFFPNFSNHLIKNKGNY